MEVNKSVTRGHGLLFQVVSIVMMIFFLMAVVVQYNDPDGVVWMVLYGVVGWVTLFHLLRPRQSLRVASLLLIILYGVGVLLLSGSFGDTSLKAFASVGMDNIAQEKVRELWGLVICFVWSVTLFVYDHFRAGMA